MYFKSFTKAAKPCEMSRVIIFDIPNVKNWVRANQIFAVSFSDTRHIAFLSNMRCSGGLRGLRGLRRLRGHQLRAVCTSFY